MDSVFGNINYDSMFEELFGVLENLPSTWECLEDVKNSIHNVFQQTYNNFMICQSTERQKNEDFQKVLFTSLENIIMASLHDQIFRLINEQFQEEDDMICRKCNDLAAMKVTADQLGAMEDYAIPLPAAVVELASLDIHPTPREKYACLSTTFDLVMAELKGALVDIIAHNEDNGIPVLNVADITPILATVIIHAKPLHLYSNMYYIENFRWSKTGVTEAESILAFKTAVDKIRVLTMDMLQPRSSRIYCDIGLEDILNITSKVDSRFDGKGERISHPKNPLERYIEHFTTNIAAAALSNVQN